MGKDLSATLVLLAAALAAIVEPAPAREPSPSFHFVPNEGQFAPGIRFGAIGGGTALAIGDGFLRMLAISGAEEPEIVQAELRWQGAQPTPRIYGIEETPARHSFFLGSNGARWRADLPAYRRVRVEEIYPGIGLLFYTNGEHLEFDYLVAPGADPSIIQWTLSGSASASLDASGDLILAFLGGDFRIRKPVAYQETGGAPREVPVRYQPRGTGSWGLELGAYNPALPLVIDPILHYSTYYGGTHFDQAHALAVDNTGNSYIVGETWSVDLLLHKEVQNFRKAGKDVFVLRMNAEFDAFAAATYFGGNGDDIATSAVLAGNDLVIGGETASTDLPGTAGRYQAASGGGKDGFLTRLHLVATPAIVATTYIGGFGSERVNAVTRDAEGSLYAAGYTTSSNFPLVLPSFGPSYQGGLNDAFVVKLNGSLTTAAWSGIYGGLGADTAEGIALGANGTVWITGSTSSAVLPAVNAVQNLLLGPFDCFVAQIASGGGSLLLSTYLGGLASENCYAIATDAEGNAVVAGASASADFPATPGAFQVSRAGSYDNVLFRIDAGTGNLGFATYLGGSQTEAPASFFRDYAGNWCIAGYTLSTNFPVAGAIQPSLAGSLDGFLSCLSADASSLVSSTYLGGTEEDRITGAAEYPGGMTLLTGLTHSSNFPVTAGALQAVPKGNGDAFLTAIDSSSVNVMPVNVSASPSTGNTEVAHITYTVEDANGYSDIRYIYTLIHNVVSAVGGCYVRYDPDAHDLRLLSDDGLYWAGLAAPGENAILQNSQCRIDASKSSVWGHATRMELTIHYSFQPGFGGVKSLLIYSQDRAGAIVGWQLRGGWVVPALAGNVQPSVTYFAPNAGTFPSNAFVIQVTDGNGAGDIGVVDFLVNGSLGYPNSCYVRYNRNLNRLQLLNDTTSQFLGSLTPGAAGTVENGKCILSGAASAASQSGNVLTLVVYLGFKTLAAGPSSMWTLVSDQSTAFLGWKLQGQITVPIGPTFSSPVAQTVAVTPLTSNQAIFEATAFDENGSGDIRDLYLLVNSGLSYPGGCFLLYRGNTAEVYLLNDAGSAWQAVGTLGASQVLENGQCKVDLSLASGSSTQDTKSVSCHIEFKPGFTGERRVYLYAEDQASLVSGWKHTGTLTLPFP